MIGDFVMAVSAVSSLLSILIGVFAFGLGKYSKKAIEVHTIGKSVNIARPEDVQLMLEALKNGEKVEISKTHTIETRQMKGIDYIYGEVTDKASGKKLVSSM